MPRRTKPSPFHEGAGSGHADKPATTWIPSPNFASRGLTDIDTLVLHNTDGALTSAIARFKDPAAQVSAHYVVGRDGQIVQMVADSDAAWHAGDRDVNRRSIGVEIVAWKTARGLTPAQEQSVVGLCRYLIGAYDIPAARVLPHRTVAATDCPGWIWPADGDLATWISAALHPSVSLASARSPRLRPSRPRSRT